jgi:hypothetical protein
MELINDKKRLPKWAVLTLIWVGPMLALWCFWTYAWGLILNVVSFPFFVLGPALILTRLILLFRSKRSAGAKIWRTILYIGILLAVLFFGMFCPYQVHRSTRINAVEKFESALPETGKRRAAFGTPELGTPEEATYHYYRTAVAVFESHAHILLCRYSPEDYTAQKDALEARYSFRTDPVIGDSDFHGENALLLEPCVRIGNDEFHFLFPWDGADKYGDRFFKTCLLFVTNDETREIGFIAFDDDELDEARDLTEFLNEECGWSVIR